MFLRLLQGNILKQGGQLRAHIDAMKTQLCAAHHADYHERFGDELSRELLMRVARRRTGAQVRPDDVDVLGQARRRWEDRRSARFRRNHVVYFVRGSNYAIYARVKHNVCLSVSLVLCLCSFYFAFSALTLLVGRQEGHPVCKKTERWGSGVVICLERGADLHMAQRIPPPLAVSYFSKILMDWFYLSDTGSPG